MKKNYNIDKHQDLIKFEKKYSARIEKFLSEDPETKTVFLNGDFGWGKTTFVKENLQINENLIYSPWLNKSENYIEDIYYNVNKCDKGKLSSRALFVSSIFALITVVFNSVISIMIEISKSKPVVCNFFKFGIVCNNSNNLIILLIMIIIVLIIISYFLHWLFYKSPIPFINFYKKENGKYYEEKLIKKILEKVDNVLVIEDIDRIDDIEEVLIAANKISKYIKDNSLNKYILITGDYARTIRRIDNPTNYNNQNVNLATERNRGASIIEKVVSLRIDFSSMEDRINNLLFEYNISANLTKIELDEIISFIKNRYLSIRFFEKFLKDYKNQINDGISPFHLLIKYYQEEKYYNIDQRIIENSIYNIERFPICINDIEMLLQKGFIKISEKFEYRKLKENKKPKGNYEIITNAFYDLIYTRKNKTIEIFKKYYDNNIFPALDSEIRESTMSNHNINIGAHLKDDMKKDLDNYLLGYNNNEADMMETLLINKRCYFNSRNSDYNYETYKISNLNSNVNNIEPVTEDEFIYAYIACFFRKNNLEIKSNYPGLSKIIEEIVNN